jgi:segregation and condensation protein A
VRPVEQSTAGAGSARAGGEPTGFRVHVGDFDGPFDLLLQLITARRLDITELSLSAVTDEFLAHLQTLPEGDDLEQASGFLVVGATLLDLKIAGLLPQGEVVDAEGLALLEERDLLFARLLQYRAFKEATGWFAEALEAEANRHAHPGTVEHRLKDVPPPLEWRTSAEAFAALALRALTPRPLPTVDLAHLHAPSVDLRREARAVVEALRGRAALSFFDLTGDEAAPLVVVARFLAVLELYRQGAVVLEQPVPLGPLVLRWIAADWDDHLLDALGRELDA